MWVLVRFKSLGGTSAQLLALYMTRICSILEFACPVFHSRLTKDQSQQIGLAEKKSLSKILGKAYQSYELALKQLQLERLDSRRTILCLKFALKCTRSTRHCGMFPPNLLPSTSTRHHKPYLEYTCKTSRYCNSPIPYLSRLLNEKIIFVNLVYLFYNVMNGL